jgi:hypothetical protein
MCLHCGHHDAIPLGDALGTFFVIGGKPPFEPEVDLTIFANKKNLRPFFFTFFGQKRVHYMISDIVTDASAITSPVKGERPHVIWGWSIFFCCSRRRRRFCRPLPSSSPPGGNDASRCTWWGHRGSAACEPLPPIFLVLFSLFFFLLKKKICLGVISGCYALST